jgi:hypothetical protein
MRLVWRLYWQHVEVITNPQHSKQSTIVTCFRLCSFNAQQKVGQLVSAGQELAVRQRDSEVVSWGANEVFLSCVSSGKEQLEVTTNVLSAGV